MGPQFGDVEDRGIGVMTTETCETVKEFTVGEADTIDHMALSEVRHKTVAHKANSVLRSVFIDYDKFNFRKYR